MIDVDEANEQPIGTANGFHHVGEGVVSWCAGSTMIEAAGFPTKRPTRESVLKRLSEALMRRTLTKVRELANKTEKIPNQV